MYDSTHHYAPCTVGSCTIHTTAAAAAAVATEAYKTANVHDYENDVCKKCQATRQGEVVEPATPTKVSQEAKVDNNVVLIDVSGDEVEAAKKNDTYAINTKSVTGDGDVGTKTLKLTVKHNALVALSANDITVSSNVVEVVVPKETIVEAAKKTGDMVVEVVKDAVNSGDGYTDVTDSAVTVKVKVTVGGEQILGSGKKVNVTVTAPASASTLEIYTLTDANGKTLEKVNDENKYAISSDKSVVTIYVDDAAEVTYFVNKK